MNISIKSSIGDNIRVTPLTVGELTEMSIYDFEKESSLNYLNSLIIKKTSLSMLDNKIIGKLINEIILVSNIEHTSVSLEECNRINDITNVHPLIFGNASIGLPARLELEQCYKNILDDIIIDLYIILEDKFKIIKELHIQPSELNKLPYWEFKKYLDMI